MFSRLEPKNQDTSLISLHYFGDTAGDIKVNEIMSKDLVTVSKNESIEDAAKLMRKKGVRRLVVLEDERIVGIITETDIAKHLKAIVGGAS